MGCSSGRIREAREAKALSARPLVWTQTMRLRPLLHLQPPHHLLQSPQLHRPQDLAQALVLAQALALALALVLVLVLVVALALALALVVALVLVLVLVVALALALA